MSLRFNVSQLLKSSPGAVREFHIEEDVRTIDQGLAITSPLVGKIRLMRSADGVLATGELGTSAELECDRCLEPFVAGLEVHLEEEYRPTVDVLTGAPLETAADLEAETLIDEAHILDLEEVLRQDLILAMPLHALCHPECAGLCPHCGQNLNQGKCDCRRTVVDARLADLAALLEKSGKEERN